MALAKETLEQSIYDGLYRIFLNQSNKATSGDEDENPEDVIKQVASDMASAISDAIDSYIKGGDISIGSANVTVVSPSGPCTVTPGAPAKMQ